ncbi:hypothetical protein, partial [Bradyrhizobium liaoningense]|uniref:hypothetical protein n=1 Tax=Bradyrhizobium liaoningense TaxID=43992 RepID=UPI0024E07988
MSDADRDSKRLADILQSGELPDLAEFAHLLGLGDEYLRPKKVPSRKPAMQTLERLHADLHGRIFNDSGTTTPPRLGGRDERDSRVDLTTRGTLVPCIKTDI